jgi:hypothetical protein
VMGCRGAFEQDLRDLLHDSIRTLDVLTNVLVLPDFMSYLILIPRSQAVFFFNSGSCFVAGSMKCRSLTC